MNSDFARAKQPQRPQTVADINKEAAPDTSKYQLVDIPPNLSADQNIMIFNAADGGAMEKLFQILKPALDPLLRQWIARSIDSGWPENQAEETKNRYSWAAARDAFFTSDAEKITSRTGNAIYPLKIEDEPVLRRVFMEYLGISAAARHLAMWEHSQKRSTGGAEFSEAVPFEAKRKFDAFYEECILPLFQDPRSPLFQATDLASNRDFLKGLLWPWALHFKDKAEQLSFLNNPLRKEDLDKICAYASDWDAAKLPQIPAAGIAAKLKAEEEAKAIEDLAKKRHSELNARLIRAEKEREENAALLEAAADLEARNLIKADIENTFGAASQENHKRLTAVLAPQSEFERVDAQVDFATVVYRATALASAIFGGTYIVTLFAGSAPRWQSGTLCLLSAALTFAFVCVSKASSVARHKLKETLKETPAGKLKGEILEQMRKNPAYGDRLVESYKKSNNKSLK